MVSEFHEVLNFNRLFLKIDRFVCNSTKLSHECGLPLVLDQLSYIMFFGVDTNCLSYLGKNWYSQ